MLIHHIFLQPQICYLLISGHSSNKKSEASELMAFFYLNRRHGWILQPPYIRNPHLRASCSYPDSDFFYLHRRHGWLTPASVYSQSALACFLLISGQRLFSTYIVDTAGLHQPPYIRNPHLRATCSYPDIRQIKNQRQASLPLIFYFPHCLRLHHAHSGAGSGWHCWSVLFDCSYC